MTISTETREFSVLTYLFIRQCLLARVSVEPVSTSSATDTPQSQTNNYSVYFWILSLNNWLQPVALWCSGNRASLHSVSYLTQDMTASEATQDFVECIFSMCGILARGRRNWVCESLKMRACWKFNSQITTYGTVNWWIFKDWHSTWAEILDVTTK